MLTISIVPNVGQSCFLEKFLSHYLYLRYILHGATLKDLIFPDLTTVAKQTQITFILVLKK
jgi:hypothetical protein